MREEELEVRQQRDRQIDRRRYRLKAPQFDAHITVLYSVLYCWVVDRTYEYEYEYTRKPMSDGPSPSHRHTRRKSGVGVSRATESVSELPSLRNTWTDGGRRLQIWRVAVCWSSRWEHKQRERTSSTYNMYDIWNVKSPKYTVLKEWASKKQSNPTGKHIYANYKFRINWNYDIWELVLVAIWEALPEMLYFVASDRIDKLQTLNQKLML